MEPNNKAKYKVTEEVLAKGEHRFFNFAIDIIMLSVLLFIGLVIFIANTSPDQGKAFMDRFLSNSLLQFTVTAVTTLLYYNLFEIFTSRTVGKYITNTIIVDENGNKAGYEAIMIRSLIRIIPLYWASLALFYPRGFHDVISKTYVVNRKLLNERKSQFQD